MSWAQAGPGGVDLSAGQSDELAKKSARSNRTLRKKRLQIEMLWYWRGDSFLNKIMGF